MKLKIYSNFILFLLPLVLLFGCKKDEKILQKNDNQVISGTWYTNKIKFNDLLNGSSEINVDYEDFKPSLIQTSLDDLPSQIKFNDDGTYTSLSHRLAIYFGLIGNVKNPNYTYGGVWQFASDGKKLYFDKGVYEFEGSSPRYFDITLLSPDSLKLETTNSQAIYDWAVLNGKTIALLDDFPKISNQCSSGNSAFPGGIELAAKYAVYRGYLDAAKNQPIDFNAFGLGLRKGSVDQYAASADTIKKYAPLADSCFNSNYNTYYLAGFNQAKSQLANYKFRTQKLTFIFSRTPNEE